jgi:hypothetical protein
VVASGVQPANRKEINNNCRRYLFIAILLSGEPCLMEAKRIQLVSPIKKIAFYEYCKVPKFHAQPLM